MSTHSNTTNMKTTKNSAQGIRNACKNVAQNSGNCILFKDISFSILHQP